MMSCKSLISILLLAVAAGTAPSERLHGAVAAGVASAMMVMAEGKAAAVAEQKNQRAPKKKRRRRKIAPSDKSRVPDADADGQEVTMSWLSIVMLLNILFFFRSFAAPFFDPLGEPRIATARSTYFSCLAFLYIWLASVTVLTVLPQFSTDNEVVIIAAALFFYMAFISICSLTVGRFLVRGVYYVWLFWKIGSSSRNALETWVKEFISSISKLVGVMRGTQEAENVTVKEKIAFKREASQLQFPVLIAFQRPFRRVMKRAVILSALLCILYSRCWNKTLSAFDISSEGGLICRGFFLPTLLLFNSSANQPTGINANSCHMNKSCADERSIWLLWIIAVIGSLFYYTVNEFSGKHHAGYRQKTVSRNAIELEISGSSSSLEVGSPGNGIVHHDIDESDDDEHDSERDTNNAQTKGWVRYNGTGRKLLHKFAKMTNTEQPEGALPMVGWYSNIIFSTGFDMLVSFKLFLGRFDARQMRVALLKEEKREEAGWFRNKSTETICQHDGYFDFSNSRSNDSSSDGFWFDFVSDVGDGFNSSYMVSRVLAQPTLEVDSPSGRRTLPRGKLLINGGDLAYPDPTPDNYEKRFFRTFEDALPPPPSFRRNHISILKPALPVKGWDLDDQQANEHSLSSYSGPCAFLIPGNHDWFDGLSTFTRYILSRDWLGGWLMPQRTSYFGLRLPKGWWILGFDLALDDDINIEQFRFFAELAASMEPDDTVILVSHVPHWILNDYEDHAHSSTKETNLTELIRTHLGSKVKLRLAGDLHHYTRHVPCSTSNTVDKPVLIVSGGGGAFLHPTHCFRDEILVGEEEEHYSRVVAYPSTKISRNLSWLNLWQFRWRNWRLDILWAVLHFGICTSLFPLCGVYHDYLEFNPTHNFWRLLLWVFSRVLKLFVQILVSGRASLFFSLVMMGIAYVFTDSSSSMKWKAIPWSVGHSCCHIASALAVCLFVECLAEYIMSEGLVVTHSDAGFTDTQSCGTGLAATIYDEYTLHFSHTLEDFKLLNTTNNTHHEPPDIFPSCEFDESLYEIILSTFMWLYHEAPFLKTTLQIFDIPGRIGNTHAEMCNILCSDGVECIYSNDFLKYQQLERITIVKYLSSISLYFCVFAVPVAGNIFGTWLLISLNYFKCQYDEGFSSLRMEHWKNLLRLHIDDQGTLKVYAIGLNRVPKKWRKDPSWKGDVGSGEIRTEPSWKWETPSKWIPWKHKKKFAPQLIDFCEIKKKGLDE